VSVTTTLPYSVKLDEALTVLAEVFNYMATKQKVNVTLFYYGSTWLTAFVAKGLLDAKKFIFTDDKVIEAVILWLIGK
jgi:hypothetical protein